MAMKGAYCKLCDCEVEEIPCAKCIQLDFLCEGTCVCCEDYRRKKQIEQSEYAASSYRNDNDFCLHCNCGPEECPCSMCVIISFICLGTCRCCKKHRRNLEDKIKRPSPKPKDSSTCSESVNQSSPDDGFCEFCQCGPVKSSCLCCRKDGYICPGTCRCCEEFRTTKVTARLLDYMNKGVILCEECTSTNSESRTTSNPEDGFCKDCQCGPEKSPCEYCTKGEYNCPGTCNCCEKHRKEEVSEKDLSKANDYLEVMSFMLGLSKGLEGSEFQNILNPDGGYCKDCQCGPMNSPCSLCISKGKICLGTCSCCKKGRKARLRRRDSKKK